jgi:hypothetical protein
MGSASTLNMETAFISEIARANTTQRPKGSINIEVN